MLYIIYTGNILSIGNSRIVYDIHMYMQSCIRTSSKFLLTIMMIMMKSMITECYAEWPYEIVKLASVTEQFRLNL